MSDTTAKVIIVLMGIMFTFFAVALVAIPYYFDYVDKKNSR